MWWPSSTSIAALLHETLFLVLSFISAFSYVMATICGPGFLPLEWEPEVCNLFSIVTCFFLTLITTNVVVGSRECHWLLNAWRDIKYCVKTVRKVERSWMWNSIFHNLCLRNKFHWLKLEFSPYQQKMSSFIFFHEFSSPNIWNYALRSMLF